MIRAALAAALMMATAAHADSYLCITEQSAGLRYHPQSQEWKGIVFNPTGKFIVSQVEADREYDVAGDQDLYLSEWIVRDFGQRVVVAVCPDGFNQSQILVCAGASSMWFSKDTMRFTAAVPGGISGHFQLITSEERRISTEVSAPSSPNRLTQYRAKVDEWISDYRKPSCLSRPQHMSPI